MYINFAASHLQYIRRCQRHVAWAAPRVCYLTDQSERADISREKLHWMCLLNVRVPIHREKPAAESHTQRGNGKGKNCDQISLFEGLSGWKALSERVKEFGQALSFPSDSIILTKGGLRDTSTRKEQTTLEAQNFFMKMTRWGWHTETKSSNWI